MNIPEHAVGTEGSGVGAGTGAQLGHRGADAAGSRWGRPDQRPVNTRGRLAPEGAWARGAGAARRPSLIPSDSVY